jgi:hypothetical protein
MKAEYSYVVLIVCFLWVWIAPVVTAIDFVGKCSLWANTAVTVDPQSLDSVFSSFYQLTNEVEEIVPGNMTISLCMHPQHAPFMWSHCADSCGREALQDTPNNSNILEKHCETWASGDHCLLTSPHFTFMHTFCPSACGFQFVFDAHVRISLGWMLPSPENREETFVEKAALLDDIVYSNSPHWNLKGNTVNLCLSDKSDLSYIIARWMQRLEYLLLSHHVFDSFNNQHESDLFAYSLNFHSTFFKEKDVVLGQVVSFSNFQEVMLTTLNQFRMKQEMLVSICRLLEIVVLTSTQPNPSMYKDLSVIFSVYDGVSTMWKAFNVSMFVHETRPVAIEKQLSSHSRQLLQQFRKVSRLYRSLQRTVLQSCSGVNIAQLPLMLKSKVCSNERTKKETCLFGSRFPTLQSPLPLVQHQLPRVFDERDGQFRVQLNRMSATRKRQQQRPGVHSHRMNTANAWQLLVPSMAFVPPVGATSSLLMRYVVNAVSVGFRWIHIPLLSISTNPHEELADISDEDAALSKLNYSNWEDSVDIIIGDAISQLVEPSSSGAPRSSPNAGLDAMEGLSRSDLFVSITVSLLVLQEFTQQLQEQNPTLKKEFRRSFGGTRTVQTINWKVTLHHYLAHRLQSLSMSYVDVVILDAAEWSTEDTENAREEHEEKVISVYQAMQSFLCPVGKHLSSKSTCKVRALGLSHVRSKLFLDRIVASSTSIDGESASRKVDGHPVIYLQSQSLYGHTTHDEATLDPNDDVWVYAKLHHRMFVVFTDPATEGRRHTFVHVPSTTDEEDEGKTTTTTANSSPFPSISSSFSWAFAAKADPILSALAQDHSQQQHHFFTAMLNDTLRPYLQSPLSSAMYQPPMRARKQHHEHASLGRTGSASAASNLHSIRSVGRHNSNPLSKQHQRSEQMISSLYGDASVEDQDLDWTASTKQDAKESTTAYVSTNDEMDLQFETLLREQEEFPWMYDMDAFEDESVSDDSQWVSSTLYRYAHTSPLQLLLLYYLMQDVGVMLEPPVLTESDLEEDENLLMLDESLLTLSNHVVYFDESTISDLDATTGTSEDSIYSGISYFADYGLRTHEVLVLDSLSLWTSYLASSLSQNHIHNATLNTSQHQFSLSQMMYQPLSFLNFHDYERQFQVSQKTEHADRRDDDYDVHSEKEPSIASKIASKVQGLLASLAPTPTSPVSTFLRSLLQQYQAQHLQGQASAEYLQKLQQVQYWQMFFLQREQLPQRLQSRQRRRRLRSLYRQQGNAKIHEFVSLQQSPRHTIRDEDGPAEFDSVKDESQFNNPLDLEYRLEDGDGFEDNAYDDPLIDGFTEEQRRQLDEMFAAV